MMLLHFTVLGKPVPQGSMKTITHRLTGKPITMHSNKKLSGWRQEVGWAALAAMNEAGLQIWSKDVPLMITAHCFIQKPQSIKKSKVYPTAARGDGDKVLRAICDALQSVVCENDGQFVDYHITKVFGLPERCEISIGVKD